MKQWAEDTSRLLLNLPLTGKEFLSQFIWYAFTYRPLSTTDTGPHKQKRKPQTAKAVQPQEVNHSLYCVCPGSQFVILSLLSWPASCHFYSAVFYKSISLVSMQQGLWALNYTFRKFAFAFCSMQKSLYNSEAALLGFTKCKENKEKEEGRCQLSLLFSGILGWFLIPFAISQ